jgi:hypothetical protein
MFYLFFSLVDDIFLLLLLLLLLFIDVVFIVFVWICVVIVCVIFTHYFSGLILLSYIVVLFLLSIFCSFLRPGVRCC